MNPRLLIQIPLLLLGSCVPMTPHTSIVVYNGGEPRMSGIEQTNQDDGPDCQKMLLAYIKSYKFPADPNFTDIDEDDAHALTKELAAYTNRLKKDLEKIVKYECPK